MSEGGLTFVYKAFQTFPTEQRENRVSTEELNSSDQNQDSLCFTSPQRIQLIQNQQVSFTLPVLSPAELTSPFITDLSFHGKNIFLEII